MRIAGFIITLLGFLSTLVLGIFAVTQLQIGLAIVSFLIAGACGIFCFHDIKDFVGR